MKKSYYYLGFSLLFPILGLWWLLARLPYRVQMKLGQWLGALMKTFMPKTKRVILTNLRLCFPELTEQQRIRLLNKNFEAVGMVFFETALAWWASPQKTKSLLHIHGMPHLQQALQEGKGVIFCSAHFLPLEIVGRLTSHYLPLAVVYRPHKNPFLNRLLSHYRQKHYEKIIPRSDLRGILRHLKENGIVWYTPDIDPGHKSSIFVPFFGVLAATVTTTARLAHISGAKVLPMFFYRQENNKGYEISISKALENFPSDDIEQDTLRINQAIEAAVRKRPEQYLWQYKRFKTRPAGEDRFYQ